MMLVMTGILLFCSLLPISQSLPQHHQEKFSQRRRLYDTAADQLRHEHNEDGHGSVIADLAARRRSRHHFSHCGVPPLDRRCVKDLQTASGSTPVFALYRNLSFWGDFVSDEFYETFMVLLVNEKGWKVFSDDLPHVDVLLVMEAYSESTIQDLTSLYSSGRVSHVLFFADDLHYFSYEQYSIKRRILTLPFVHIVTTVAPQLPLFYPNSTFANKVLWCPHSAARRFNSKHLNTSAVPKVLLPGSVNVIYRYRLLAKTIMDASNGTSNIVQVPHPGYEKYTEHSKFVDGLMPYAYALTCGLSLNYVVAKFFEIPATGHMLLANPEIGRHLHRLCYIEGRHYRRYTNVTLENMVNNVNVTLDEDLSIRKEGKKLIHALHTTEHRAQLLMQIAVSLAQGKAPRGFYYAESDTLPIFDPEYVQLFETYRQEPKKSLDEA